MVWQMKVLIIKDDMISRFNLAFENSNKFIANLIISFIDKIYGGKNLSCQF